MRKSPGYPSIRHFGGKGGVPQLCPVVGEREDFWKGGDILPGSTMELVSSLRSPSCGMTLLLQSMPVTPSKPPRASAVVGSWLSRPATEHPAGKEGQWIPPVA